MGKYLTILVAGLAMSNVYASGSIQEIIDAAEAEVVKAEKSGFLWRDTEKLLKQGRQAINRADHKQGEKLIKQAVFQAKAAQQQAKDQADAGPRF